MKKAFKNLLILSSMTIGLISVASCTDSDVYVIGILQYGNFEALNNATEGIRQAVEDAGYDESQIIIDVKNANAESTTNATLAAQLVETSDMVIGVATPSALALATEADNQGKDDLPILFTAVTDPVAASLVASNEAPGGMITGTSDMNPVVKQIDLIKDVIPDADKIGILYTSTEQNSIVQANMAIEEAGLLGMTAVTKTCTDSNDLQTQAEALMSDETIDAVFLPTDNIVANGSDIIGIVAEEYDMPVITGESGMIAAGVATLGINYLQLGVITGEMAVSIYEGKSVPSTTPVQTLTEYDLIINQTMADKIGITIPAGVLEDADQII